ncbi:hypothetical protein M406DRAFT_249362, partial [Cryphonectria parasitica EP155]
NIQIFLKFTKFYYRFIQNYSKIAILLINLLQSSSIGIIMLSNCIRVAFKTLIILFIIASLLCYYNAALLTRVETNASAFAIRAVLA